MHAHVCLCTQTRVCAWVPECARLPVCMFMHTHMHLIQVLSFLHTHMPGALVYVCGHL